jgi:hypothetical protein
VTERSRNHDGNHIANASRGFVTDESRAMLRAELKG